MSELIPPTPSVGSDTGESAAAYVQNAGENAVAFITDRGLVAWWKGDILNYYYWLVGYGTGYEMTSEIELLNSDGTEFRKVAGVSVRESVPIPTFLNPTLPPAKYLTRVSCGLTANVRGRFRVWLGVDVPLKLSLEVLRESLYWTAQPGCAPVQPTPSPVDDGTTGGDLTPTQTSGGLKICYYSVYVDINGDIVDVTFLSCHALPNPNVA